MRENQPLQRRGHANAAATAIAAREASRIINERLPSGDDDWIMDNEATIPDSWKELSGKALNCKHDNNSIEVKVV